MYPGANRSLDKAWIDKVLTEFSKGDILLLQNEVNLIDYLIIEGKKKGMNIFLNPSPYDEYIDKCDLSLVNTFLMNEVEGAQITGCYDPECILTRMKNLYPQAKVVLTLGQDGVYFQDKGAARVSTRTNGQSGRYNWSWRYFYRILYSCCN